MFKFNCFDTEEIKQATIGTVWFSSDGDTMLHVTDIRNDILFIEIRAPWGKGFMAIDRGEL